MTTSNRAGSDNNQVKTIIAPLNTDGKTPVAIIADPSTHGLSVDDNTTGSDFGPLVALHDVNDNLAMMAVSSSDGVTPVVLYATAAGVLLIKST